MLDNQLDIFWIDTGLINRTVVFRGSLELGNVVITVVLLLLALDSRGTRVGGSELLSGIELSLGVRVLDLGLAENDVAVGVGGLVDVGVGENEENLEELTRHDTVPSAVS